MSERSWSAIAPFVLAIGVSSASLFVLQPMCARMVLPYLGGSPSVWTTCMLFFQAGLLGGYLYAHASGRIGLRVHAVLHLVLLALACVFLPPLIASPAGFENTESPVLWLLTSLVAAIGLPYLLLASSAPLLQVWFARAGSAPADPYFLYAASNAGSLLGLLAYVFVLEPLIGLRQQSYVWSGCFILFAALTAGCAVILWKRDTPTRVRASAKSSRGAKAKKVRPIGGATIAKWLFLSFVPSSLLLSVTVHLTADVASLPFLWVVPLGVYLITYVLAFSARGSGTHRLWIRWLPLAVLVIAIVLLSEGTEPLLLIILLHLLGLFWIGMVGHGELARSRPPVANLTTFYLCIAVGGALGGVFNALVAPAIFNRLVEYPVALVLASLIPAFATTQMASSAGTARRQWKWDVVLPLLLVLLICGLIFVDRRAGLPPGPLSAGLIFGVPLVICYTFSGRPIRFALGIAALFVGGSVYPGVHGEADRRVRSFFGVHRVTRDAQHRTLVHGNTVHGLQSLDPARRGEPLAYYARSGPIGELLAALSPADPRLKRVAVLGLGAGALAAYAQPGQTWTFYEIDPAVVRIARNDFTFLQDATHRGAQISIVPGDARLQIGRAQEQYGLIILDAFSSDSIPTHLFTREALAIYRERLTENGIIAIHYSSRYFDLLPVLGALANVDSSNGTAFFREDLWLAENERLAGKAPSKWAVFLQTPQDPISAVLSSAGWHPIETERNPPPWTDDHSNVLGALRLFPE